MEQSEAIDLTVSKNREIFGYAVGVLGLIVSMFMIYGFGQKFHFGRRRLTVEEMRRPVYETILACLPGRYTTETLYKYVSVLICFIISQKCTVQRSLGGSYLFTWQENHNTF